MIKFDVLNRFSGEIQFTAEIDCSEEQTSSVKLGLAVRWAIKSRAYLSGAYLSGAYLSGAYLSGADLSGADLSGADLSRAYLSGAKGLPSDIATQSAKSELPIPVVPNIDAAILAAIEAGGRLDMSSWHICETTHCRAGWAIHLAGEQGYALEAKYGSQTAGAMIYYASRPDKPAPWFFAPTDVAMADIKACAAEQLAQPAIEAS